MSVQQGELDLSLLRDTVCVVTGAGNGGIGYGICEVAAGLGLHIALVDLFPTIAQGAAAKLRERFVDVEVFGYACDVTMPGSLKCLVSSIRKDFAGIRIGAVFANAGVSFPATSFLTMQLTNVRKTFEVNCVGVVATLQAFVPLLRESKEPSVCCTTASIGGMAFGGFGGLFDYCASKHAVINLTEGLAAELSQTDCQIRVHVCCPCLVKTGLMITSQAAQSADPGSISEVTLPQMPAMDDLLMTPTNHGHQVWDRIAHGEFYMICDNIRPYVDHDFPFDGAGLMQRRVNNLLKPDLQRSWDMNDLTAGRARPLSLEMARRLKTTAKL